MQNLFSVEILVVLLCLMSLYLFLRNVKYKNTIDSMNKKLAYNYVNQMFISKLITMVTHNYTKSIGDIMYLVKKSFGFDGILIYDLSFDMIKFEISKFELNSYVKENKASILAGLKGKKIINMEYDNKNICIMPVSEAPNNLMIIFAKPKEEHFLSNEEDLVLFQIRDIVAMIYDLSNWESKD